MKDFISYLTVLKDIFFLIHSEVDPQTHRLIKVGKEIISSNPPAQAGPPRTVGQPVLVSHQPHSEEFLPNI